MGAAAALFLSLAASLAAMAAPVAFPGRSAANWKVVFWLGVFGMVGSTIYLTMEKSHLERPGPISLIGVSLLGLIIGLIWLFRPVSPSAQAITASPTPPSAPTVSSANQAGGFTGVQSAGNITNYNAPVTIKHDTPPSPPAAQGGHVTITGSHNLGIGGPAGASGIEPGGPGGNVEIHGDNNVGIGGEGGEGPQPDGRGGRGGRNPLVAQGIIPADSWLAQFGRGGDAANTPEYNARVAEIEKMRSIYIRAHPEQSTSFWISRESVPIDWLNKQLEEQGYSWRVRITREEYEFYDAASR